MLLYAGIDEAGYGPMLGPLCIGCTLFRVESADASRGAPDLWELLESAVCRRPTDKRRRIAVDDSKTLKGARGSKAHPLRHLERGVLAFVQSMNGSLPADDRDLYRMLGVALPDEPWYEGDVHLPLWGEAGEHRIAGSMLQRSMEEAGIGVLRIGCEIIHPPQINAAASGRERKSDLNLAAALRQVGAVNAACPGAHPRVVIDRQGGRTSYREHLALAWPEAPIRILGETPRISRYRVETPDGLLTVSFEAGSEERHLPVALASMVAKLVRELHMIRLNAFFSARMPELKPTAGYVQDGRRFMREIGSLVQSLELDQSRLVRKV